MKQRGQLVGTPGGTIVSYVRRQVCCCLMRTQTIETLYCITEMEAYNVFQNCTGAMIYCSTQIFPHGTDGWNINVKLVKN